MNEAVLLSGNPSVAPHGAEQFEWDPSCRELQSVWANQAISPPNGIPSMSAATGLIMTWVSETASGPWKRSARRQANPFFTL